MSQQWSTIVYWKVLPAPRLLQPAALAKPSHLQEFDDQEDDAPIVPVEGRCCYILSTRS
jgi:hypothetical protein